MARQTDPNLAAAVAVTRFGLGARPGEIARVGSDPTGWLDAQVTPSGAPNPPGAFPSTDNQIQAFIGYQAAGRDARQARQAAPEAPPAPSSMTAMAEDAPSQEPAREPPRDAQAQAAFDARREARRDIAQDGSAEFLARVQHGATTDAGFAERWALFWANAFTVSATKFQSGVFVGAYEREAIRPHVFGRFEDLAFAAESHPAMLLYLDQAQSVGPNSLLGERREAGLNENLAREILELHTVGADGGYTQADVTEFARALTGWSIPSARDAQQQARGRRAQMRAAQASGPGFVFRPGVHEPGARTVMGRAYPEGGLDQGRTVLRDLANHPRTARRLSLTLARHFVADDPPPAVVDRLEAAWTGSRGDLAQVARALIAAPEAWSPQPAKIKTPYDFLVSTHRALGTQPKRVQGVQQPLVQMGQPPWRAPSPEGWPDTAADWAGPDALVKRLNWAKTVGDRAPDGDPSALASAALGPRLSERTRLAVARAESRPEAVTLFLMSPEFQRR